MVFLRLSFLFLALSSLGCGGESDSDEQPVSIKRVDRPENLNGPDFRVDLDTSAKFHLSVTPAPDVVSLVVRLARFGARKSNRQWIYATLDSYEEIDLMKLQDGKTTSLTNGFEFEDSSYSATELTVDDAFESYITVEESEDEVSSENLEVEDLVLEEFDFEIPEDAIPEFLVNIDLRQGLDRSARKSKLTLVTRTLPLNDAKTLSVIFNENKTGVVCLYDAKVKNEVLTKKDEVCTDSYSSFSMTDSTEGSFYNVPYGDYKAVLLTGEEAEVKDITFSLESPSPITLD